MSWRSSERGPQTPHNHFPVEQQHDDSIMGVCTTVYSCFNIAVTMWTASTFPGHADKDSLLACTAENQSLRRCTHGGRYDTCSLICCGYVGSTCCSALLLLGFRMSGTWYCSRTSRCFDLDWVWGPLCQRESHSCHWRNSKQVIYIRAYSKPLHI